MWKASDTNAIFSPAATGGRGPGNDHNRAARGSERRFACLPHSRRHAPRRPRRLSTGNGREEDSRLPYTPLAPHRARFRATSRLPSRASERTCYARAPIAKKRRRAEKSGGMRAETAARSTGWHPSRSPRLIFLRSGRYAFSARKTRRILRLLFPNIPATLPGRNSSFFYPLARAPARAPACGSTKARAAWSTVLPRRPLLRLSYDQEHHTRSPGKVYKKATRRLPPPCSVKGPLPSQDVQPSQR